MALDFWGKIEHIRKQPEHVRMRYVFGCLVVSMTFIVGIWILSVRESFQGIAKELPQAAEKGKDLLPKGDVQSLSDLLKQATPLQVEGESKTGEQFFEEQVQARNDNQENVSSTQDK